MSREDRIARKHRLLGDDYLLPSEREALGEEGEFAEDELDRADRFAREMDNSDQLVQKSRLKQASQAEVNAQAPFATVNPPSVFNGIIGNTALVGFDGAAKQVAWWPGLDAEARPVTCTFGPVGQFSAMVRSQHGGPPPPPAPALRPYGIITFGTSGAPLTFELDIGQGCHLTIGAAQVTLQVALELNATPGLTQQVPISGMLSFYPVVRTKPITRTKYFDAVPASGGTTGPVPLPAFAKDLIVWRQTATAIDIVGADSAGNITFDVTLAAGTPMFTPILFPGDTAVVAIVNNDVAVTTNVRLVFGLDL